MGHFGRVLHWLQDTPEVPWPWSLQPVVAGVKILCLAIFHTHTPLLKRRTNFSSFIKDLGSTTGTIWRILESDFQSLGL